MNRTAYQLFKTGFDYVEIARILNTTEAEVEKRIHAYRMGDTHEAKLQYMRDYYRTVRKPRRQAEKEKA